MFDLLLPVIDAKLGGVNPSSSGTDTVFHYLKNIDSKLPITVGTNYRGYSPRLTYATNNIGGTMVSVSGTGLLTAVLVGANVNATFTSALLTVDGTPTLTLTPARNGNPVILMPMAKFGTSFSVSITGGGGSYPVWALAVYLL